MKSCQIDRRFDILDENGVGLFELLDSPDKNTPGRRYTLRDKGDGENNGTLLVNFVGEVKFLGLNGARTIYKKI